MEEKNEPQFTKMSLTDYAKVKGVSIQSISQTFKRHQSEMSGMFQKVGRKTVLTEDGVQFLDKVREKDYVPMAATSPETFNAMKDRIRVLEQQLEKEKEDRTAESQKKDDRIRDLEQMIKEKDSLISFKDQVIMTKDQQMLLLTTSQKKKGIVQRFREWVTGVDEQPLPGGGNDTFSSQDKGE